MKKVEFPWGKQEGSGYVGFQAEDGAFLPDRQTYLRYSSLLKAYWDVYETVCKFYIDDYSLITYRGRETYQIYQMINRQSYEKIIAYFGFRFFFEKDLSWKKCLPQPPKIYPIKLAITLGEGDHVYAINAHDLMMGVDNSHDLYDKMCLSDKYAKIYMKG